MLAFSRCRRDAQRDTTCRIGQAPRVQSKAVWPLQVELAPAYLIGSLGAYWTIQRTVLMV
jgi:hypothetical protein